MGSAAEGKSVPDQSLRRSMVVSATASAVGMGLAAVVGGNIFSRFLEYAGYYKYLYIFLAVMPLSKLLQIFGAWALQRTGWRRFFFYLFLGPPRLLWILIVMLPAIPMPDGYRLISLVGLVSLYWITTGPGGNAWFSWMRDLLPRDYRGRYFGYRRVGGTAVRAIWGLAAGYLLEALGLGHKAFLVVYSVSVAMGLMDIFMFVFVDHPPMRTKAGPDAGLRQMLRAAAHKRFIKFTAVHAVWMFSCSANFISNYMIMRTVGLEIGAIQLVASFGTVLHLIFSLLWGKFVDHYGAKAAYCLSILAHAIAPFCYAMTPKIGITASFLGTTFVGIGVSGVIISNLNLLMALSRAEDMPMTMATRGTVSSLMQGGAYLLTGSLLHPFFQSITPEWADKSTFFLVMTLFIVFLMRLVAFSFALNLPEIEEKRPSGIVVRTIFTTSPVTAFYSLGRFLRAKSSDIIPPDSYGDEHPSARWRME